MSIGLEMDAAMLPASGTGIEAGAHAAPLSLKRNTVWTMAGNTAYAASQWLQVAAIARLGSTLDVGRYAFALGLCAPVFMLANLQLRPIQATDSLRRYAFGDYLGLRLATTAAALAATLVLAAVFSASLQDALLVAAIAGAKSFESVSDVYQGVFQQHERMDRAGLSLLLKSSLVLPVFGLLYYYTASLACAAAGVALAHLTTLLTYDMPASHRVGHGVMPGSGAPRFQPAALRKLAKRALPLGITMMLISLHANAPRFIIEKYLGSSGLGVFAAIAYLSLAGAMVVNAIGSAASPRLAAYAAGGDARGFRNLLGKLVAIAAGLGIAGVAVSLWFGRDLLHILYGVEYARHGNLLVWSMTAGALSYIGSMFGYAATALGRFEGQPWALALTILALLGAGILLVPQFGLPGAALATVISSAICLCAYVALVCWRSSDESRLP
jgi:O-antigen/teichoic acid export membrane protein